MVRTGLFDIVAHLDVPKRGHVPLFGPFDCRTCEEQIREILAEIIRTGAVLEINTAGLRKQANEIFPSLEILRLYRGLGGELITFGSDCHSPQKVGIDFDKAVEAAEAAGFAYITTFEGRKPGVVPLRLARGC
jgi:histidinol-phosphatase (PHP family)